MGRPRRPRPAAAAFPYHSLPPFPHPLPPPVINNAMCVWRQGLRESNRPPACCCRHRPPRGMPDAVGAQLCHGPGAGEGAQRPRREGAPCRGRQSEKAGGLGRGQIRIQARQAGGWRAGEIMPLKRRRPAADPVRPLSLRPAMSTRPDRQPPAAAIARCVRPARARSQQAAPRHSPAGCADRADQRSRRAAGLRRRRASVPRPFIPPHVFIFPPFPIPFEAIHKGGRHCLRSGPPACRSAGGRRDQSMQATWLQRRAAPPRRHP